MTEEDIASQLIAERERLEQAAGLARVRHFRRPEERPFTAAERQRVTILFGGLTWKHEKFIQAVFHGSGYRCEILPNPNLTTYHLGRELGNPAQCNPTYFTVGSLISTCASWKQGVSANRKSWTTTSFSRPGVVGHAASGCMNPSTGWRWTTPRRVSRPVVFAERRP